MYKQPSPGEGKLEEHNASQWMNIIYNLLTCIIHVLWDVIK